MNNYLSFGGGVNSVALHLYLLKQGTQFESVFVNHGEDWPETYEYVNMFQSWLKKNGHSPITVLTPNINGSTDIYNYCDKYAMIPSRMKRWCTEKFKIRALKKHYQKPCFAFIGYDFDEVKRAKIVHEKGVEKRFPLIEAEITRAGCKDIIKKTGLPVPMKSGCYFCPFQRIGQWKELRRKHPDLFCKANKLEQKTNADRKRRGKSEIYLIHKPLRLVVDEKQRPLFEIDALPPCECAF